MSTAADTGIFDELESNVRAHRRAWPVVFDRAVGSRMYAGVVNPLPDLTISDEELDQRLGIIEQAVLEVCAA